MKVDLHLHTSASDGTWSPGDLIQNIIDSGIGIFSVTDHDSVENVEAVSSLAREKSLTFFKGVEINTFKEGQAFHILGYNIDTDDKTLNNTLLINRDFLVERNEESITVLSEKGHPVSRDEYNTYQNNPARGGWKALNYAIDKGLCRTYKEFFSLFGENRELLVVDGFVKPEAAISSIKEAGGITVLAHPGSVLYGSDYNRVVAAALDMGVEGIECYHPENRPEVTERCLEISKKNGLYITGGSDCHGDFVKERWIGKPDIDLSQLALWKF
jgi:predicted metal-dependent phosphoesterase TrpH